MKSGAETGQQKKAQGPLYRWDFLLQLCVENEVFPKVTFFLVAPVTVLLPDPDVLWETL